MLHALGLLLSEYKTGTRNNFRKNLLLAKCVAKLWFSPFLLWVGNLPRSTLPLQE